jgi:RNA polymerase sigma-70 factor (ECF subfamily)
LNAEANDRIDRLFRAESGRAVAALARIFNDFDRAEDAVQDAYLKALDTWPATGVPRNTAAWIVTTARNAAIDRLRREKAAALKYELVARLEAVEVPGEIEEPTMDDRLATIFAACHPALAEETRIVLTLRFAAGLTVAEIATALVSAPATIAQRLVRAKKKIREARIPFSVPEDRLLPERLNDVLRVLYLIFNEGYASSTNAERVRAELCDDALRLAELLDRLLPAEPEIDGLRALFLFHDARRATRVDDRGDPVLLEYQDRTRWDTRKIVRGLTILERAQRQRSRGPYQLQAAIAAEHARALAWEDTNWFRIRECYEQLLDLEPSPVIALNRAVAVAYTDGPAAGIAAIDDIAASGALRGYAPLYAARAELLRRIGDDERAKADYASAISLTQSEPERRLLERRAQTV